MAVELGADFNYFPLGSLNLTGVPHSNRLPSRMSFGCEKAQTHRAVIIINVIFFLNINGAEVSATPVLFL